MSRNRWIEFDDTWTLYDFTATVAWTRRLGLTHRDWVLNRMRAIDHPPFHGPEMPFRLDLPLDEWQMTHAERCALVMLLSQIRPGCSIEIGTAHGGSLAVLSHFSRQVYSLDTSPTTRQRLGHKFPNAEFVTGRSEDTLPPLLQRLQTEGADVSFILIDGDHSREGVKRDIENVLRFRPTRPLHVLIHDSFNPSCRRGIAEANWAISPHVHSVELDFLPGVLHAEPRWYRQMWDGFALAVLRPAEREVELPIGRAHELQFRALRLHSVHSPSLWRRVRARVDASRKRRMARNTAEP